MPGSTASKDTCCGGATMMAVRDVERRNAAKLGFEELHIRRLCNEPGAVAHAILCCEIDAGRLGALPGNKFMNISVGPINQEHRPRLRIQRLDVADAVFLFFGTRQ